MSRKRSITVFFRKDGKEHCNQGEAVVHDVREFPDGSKVGFVNMINGFRLPVIKECHERSFHGHWPPVMTGKRKQRR